MLGAGMGNGVFHLLCFWGSLPVISVSWGHTLKSVNNPPVGPSLLYYLQINAVSPQAFVVLSLRVGTQLAPSEPSLLIV